MVPVFDEKLQPIDKSFCHLLHIPWHIPYSSICFRASSAEPSLELEDVDIVLGLNHTIYLPFALLLFDEHSETADHSQYEIKGVLKNNVLLRSSSLATLVIRNAGKKEVIRFSN